MTTATQTQSTTVASAATAIAVVSAETVFDAIQTATTRATVEQLIQAKSEAIVIDFTHTTFMDSSGLGVLLHLRKASQLAGVPLYLAALNAQCRMLFELTRADAIFAIVPDASVVFSPIAASVA